MSGKTVRTTDANEHETGRDELDPSGVKVDGQGQEHHGGGSGGGGGRDPGGAQARIASLANLSMVEVGGILVPFAVAGSFHEHMGETSSEFRLFWDYGLWFGGGYRPNDSAIFLAAQELDPESLIEYKKGEIDAEAFAVALINALVNAGYLPSSAVQNNLEPQRRQPQDGRRRRVHDPCTNVNAAMANEGGGFYTYEDANWLRFGQPQMIAVLTTFAGNWDQAHPNNPIGVGDLSQLGGAGDFNRHPGGGHPGGVIVDLRPMRNDNVRGGTNFHDATYSRDLTSQLIQDLAALPDVVSIRFNDPQIQNNKLVRDIDRFDRRGRRLQAAHDNHLHVVFRSAAPCPVEY